MKNSQAEVKLIINLLDVTLKDIDKAGKNLYRSYSDFADASMRLDRVLQDLKNSLR